jgi:uncharacterized protein
MSKQSAGGLSPICTCAILPSLSEYLLQIGWSSVQPVQVIVMVVVVSVIIGLSKGGMGAALVVLVTPLLSQVMPVKQAISVSLPLLIIADGFALWIYWKKWDMYYIRVMVLPAIGGIIVGTQLLATLSDVLLRQILAVFTLIFIAYRLVSDQLRTLEYHPQKWHGYLAGAASGFGSALANTGAPPFTAYMLLQRISPEAFAGTTTLFFAIVNAVKLPGLVLAGLFNVQDLLSVAWVIPLIPLGVWLGRWLLYRLNKVAFERFMLVVLFIAAMVLLVFVPTQ